MDQTLRRKLDRITDILWAGGVTNPVTYIEQISYLIYLKLLDEEETTRELRGRLGAGDGPSLFPLQASRYRAVVVPEGALFGSTKAHKALREHLLRQYQVQAVVSLPAGVFKPYAGVKTSVLVLRRPSNEPETGASATTQVWFYEIRNDGYDPDKIQGGGRPETPAQNDIPGLLAAWADYKASRFLEPQGAEANALLGPGTEEPRCWWTLFETIAENDYNLAASRYKPRVAEPVPDENPAELIREVLAIEREITDGLEKLLTEVEQ